MNWFTLGIFLSLWMIMRAYNPIPMGAVIISTTDKIFVMRPTEYGGTDELDIIFTAPSNMTIVNSIYDPTARNLFLIFLNTTNGTLYLCKLASVETLDSTVYQLPITYSTTMINKTNSFSADVDNRRAFYTDQNGRMNLFSMSGLLITTISSPLNSSSPIRSVAYTDVYDRLFIITDVTVDSCTNLDTNNLQCCEALPRGAQFCAITFDVVGGDLYAYVLDRTTGIYQIVLNGTGCPTALRPVNKLGPYTNLQFAIDRGLYFASGSSLNGDDNSNLYIANGTDNPRTVSIGTTIVALHVSIPSTQVTSPTQETCFHGITYSLYRTAVVLAALFGTIMGIFMCFNALFCIDFFMTKRIIRGLKEQIPHNLLEDRWNKLVEEKYAILALEKQRRKDDPPPSQRKASVSARKNSSAVIPVNDDNTAASASTTSSTLQVPHSRPGITDFLRRKSESYLSRRRSADYRSHRNQPGQELTEIRSHPARDQVTTTQVHEPLHEENEKSILRQNLSKKELLKDVDFL